MTPRAPLALRVAATTAIVLVAAAACTDKPAQPTAPRAPRQAAAAVVPGAPAVSGVSTVCLAYMTKQSVAQQKLEEAREQHAADEVVGSLRSRVEKLDEIVADACN